MRVDGGTVEKSGKSTPAAVFSSYLDPVSHFTETSNVNNERDFQRRSEKSVWSNASFCRRGTGVCATPGSISSFPDPWDKALSFSPDASICYWAFMMEQGRILFSSFQGVWDLRTQRYHF